MAGYFRGTREYGGGLIELALTSSSIRDGLAEVSQRIEGTNVSFVAGTRSHTQAPALRDLWQPLLGGTDRPGVDRPRRHRRRRAARTRRVARTLCSRNADLTLVVTRTNLPSISAVRSWADSDPEGHVRLAAVGRRSSSARGSRTALAR
ncbi:MAG: hypothetical protein V9F00_17660 [Nocardioides sp.]